MNIGSNVTFIAVLLRTASLLTGTFVNHCPTDMSISNAYAETDSPVLIMNPSTGTLDIVHYAGCRQPKEGWKRVQNLEIV